MVNVIRQRVAKVEKVESFENQYVYDISMIDQDPFFFANGSLVHNTDSAYFTSNPVKKELTQQGLEFNKDAIAKFYDAIADSVNETFSSFMIERFNTTQENSQVIKAGREICGTKGIFVKKKRYAILVYDSEGFRTDIDGNPGKLKIMGMDTQRSDTPKYVQDFLKELLLRVLTDSNEQDINNFISKFRESFSEMDPWTMGAPTRVNGLSSYAEKEKQFGKINMPGHVRASLNYNKLRKGFSDNYSLEITDGMKVFVCKLKKNPLNMTSIAIPVDESRVPTWFKELPFDVDSMETALIDKKISNLIGVLNWDLSHSKANSALDNLFGF